MVNFKKLARRALSLFPGGNNTGNINKKVLSRKADKEGQDQLLSVIFSPTSHNVTTTAPMTMIKKSSDNGLSDAFIRQHFGDSKVTYKTVSFTSDKMGMIINCRRSHCCVVTDLVEGSQAAELGVSRGDIIIAINNEKPEKWLNGVSEQLRNASRPCVIEFVRYDRKSDGIFSSLEVNSALKPWKSTGSVDLGGVTNGMDPRAKTEDPVNFEIGRIAAWKRRTSSTPKKNELKRMKGAKDTPKRRTHAPSKNTLKKNKKVVRSSKKRK